jgi:hypothetical protein
MNKTMMMMVVVTILKMLHCTKHTIAVTVVDGQVEFRQHKLKYGKR